MKIAFFDSGIGGLSVLHHAQKILPEEQFLFYADEKHVPYGEKTREQVMQYVSEAVAFLMTQDVKAIVLACNTATSVAVQEMRRRYDIPIIGMEPAVKKAIDLYGAHRVLVTATPITVQGDKMRCLIEKVDQHHLVDLVPLPKLVRFAEQGEFLSEQVTAYLQQEFAAFSLSEYASLVLGCTHFNYFKDSLRAILPENIHFVDGNAGTVAELVRQLQKRDLLEHNTSDIQYYTSGERVTDAKILHKIAQLMQRLEKMDTVV